MNDAQTTEDFWHVQLLSGEVRFWSLEELDEAFQRDEVDAKTYVLKQGDAAWQRLGDLLGLEDEDTAAPIPVVAPVPLAVTYTLPTPEAGFRLSDAPGALSLRPVVSDMSELDDDELAAAMKPKRRKAPMIAGGAALAVALVVVAATRGSSGADEKVAAAVPPPPVATMPSSPAEEPVATQPTLSENVKRTLLEADKARAAKAAARAAENAKYQPTRYASHSTKGSQVFHKGGSKYDPLAQ